MTSTKPRCSFCRRDLRVIVHTPTEIEPHCTSPGCRWCGECYRGETVVSPRNIATRLARDTSWPATS